MITLTFMQNLLEVYIGSKDNEQYMTGAGNPDNVTTVDSSSFKYKSSLLGNPRATGVLKNAK